MSSTGVPGLIFQCVFEGSLSMQDTEIERRPYHKNCSCALHSKAGVCSNACQIKEHFLSQETVRYQQLPNSLLLLLATCPQTQETEKILKGFIIRPCHTDDRGFQRLP